jgi:DNA-binding NarL/FixJ family response regulator
MTRHPTLRVLVMHGEHLIDAGLAISLARHADIEILAPCPAGIEASDLPGWVAGQNADVVITDYSRGLSLAEAWQLSRVPPQRGRSRIVIVTSRATQNEIRSALKQGVAGYLTVTSAADEVIDAVRKANMGMRHVSEPLARIMLEDLLGDQLTPRESEVLGLAAQGCATKVIAARLQVEPATVASHMKSVMDKLNAGNRTEAVVIANQRGLVALEGAGQSTHSVGPLSHRHETTIQRRRPPRPEEWPRAPLEISETLSP